MLQLSVVSALLRFVKKTQGSNARCGYRLYLCKIVLWWGVNNRSWSCRLFLLLPRNIFHWLPCLLWPWISCRLRVDILLRSLLWPWVSCRLWLDFLLRSWFRTGLWSWFRLCDRLTWLLLHIWSWVGRLDRCYGTCK